MDQPPSYDQQFQKYPVQQYPPQQQFGVPNSSYQQPYSQPYQQQFQQYPQPNGKIISFFFLNHLKINIRLKFYFQVPYNPQIVVTQPPVVVLNGGCPNCRVGMLVDDYSCLAVFLAIFFFPIGVLCCLAMREKRCTNCRQSF